MFRNYWMTAVRSLLRHRFFSIINIFGLAMSMSISMSIIMLVADQMMYDRYNPDSGRIFRVNTVPVGRDGAEHSETGTTVLPLRDELLESYTGIEKAVRLKRGFGNNWFEFEQDITVPVSGYFADPEALDFFRYELEYGDAATALAEPYSLVLTKKAARKLFRQENPVGQMLRVRDKEIYKVTGIIRETKNKSHIVFDALASMATVKSREAAGQKERMHDWFSYTDGWTYIMVEHGKSPEMILGNLRSIEEKKYSNIVNPDTQQRLRFRLQGILDITPGPFINNPIGPFLPWIFIYFFAGIAGVVLLTSCFNFTSLSIARSVTRAREIGVRKVTGAMRSQICVQFLSESVVTSLFSLVVAIALVIVLKPMILQLSFAHLLMWDFELNYAVVGIFILLALAVGILAGIFPALVMSRFEPVKVLKNLTTGRLFSRIGFRKALLVVQFTCSLIFILTVLVVFNQLNLFLRADHGFQMENKIAIQLNNTSARALKTELLKYTAIENVATTSHLPAAGNTRATNYKRSFDDKDWTSLCYYSTDEDYLKNMQLSLIAGKFFTAARGESNKNFIVLSEKAVKIFQFKSAEDAIGQELILQQDSSRRQVIGVVRDYNHQLLMEKMDPLGLVYNPGEYALLQVSYKGSFEEAGKVIEKAWAAVNPDRKVDYKDFSSEVHKLYNVFFGDLAEVLTVVSFLAILISSLGLLGMATYTTETRRKEISIRKVLGSENLELVYLLSKGFLVIILFAIGIAVPAGWYLNSLWLEKLPYHVSVDAPVIAAGIIILIIFGVVTIGSQTWRAAFINPVDNLKGE